MIERMAIGSSASAADRLGLLWYRRCRSSPPTLTHDKLVVDNTAVKLKWMDCNICN